MIKSKTIVFITGAFISHACWDNWKTWFEAQGYKVVAPPWPAKDADAASLRRRHPDKLLAAVTLPDLVAHYTKIIKELPEKPILIGHSFGGLLVQILLNKDLAAAGIAMHSVPPQGIIPYELNFFKSNAKALGFFTSLDKTYLLSFKTWQFAFTNGMTLSEQKATYEQLAIPESKRVVRGSLTKAAYVDFKKGHNPLLILSGSIDQCIPASLNKRNFNKYKNKYSVVEYVVKEGRNHFVLGLPTWEEDAKYISDWINKH